MMWKKEHEAGHRAYELKLKEFQKPLIKTKRLMFMFGFFL